MDWSSAIHWMVNMATNETKAAAGLKSPTADIPPSASTYSSSTALALEGIGIVSVVICIYILSLLIYRKPAADQVLDMGLIIVNLAFSITLIIASCLSILTRASTIDSPITIITTVAILLVIYSTSLTVVLNAWSLWQINVKGKQKITYFQAYIKLFSIWAISLLLALTSVLTGSLQYNSTGLITRAYSDPTSSLALRVISEIVNVLDLVIVIPPPLVAVYCYGSMYLHLREQSIWIKRMVQIQRKEEGRLIQESQRQKPAASKSGAQTTLKGSFSNFETQPSIPARAYIPKQSQNSVKKRSTISATSRLGDYKTALRNSAGRGCAIFILYIVFIVPLVIKNSIWRTKASPSDTLTMVTYILFAFSGIVTPLIFAFLDRRIRYGFEMNGNEEQLPTSIGREDTFRQRLRGKGTEYEYENGADFQTVFGKTDAKVAASTFSNGDRTKAFSKRRSKNPFENNETVKGVIVLDPTLAFSTRSLHSAPSDLTLESEETYMPKDTKSFLTSKTRPAIERAVQSIHTGMIGSDDEDTVLSLSRDQAQREPVQSGIAKNTGFKSNWNPYEPTQKNLNDGFSSNPTLLNGRRVFTENMSKTMPPPTLQQTSIQSRTFQQYPTPQQIKTQPPKIYNVPPMTSKYTLAQNKPRLYDITKSTNRVENGNKYIYDPQIQNTNIPVRGKPSAKSNRKASYIRGLNVQDSRTVPDRSIARPTTMYLSIPDENGRNAPEPILSESDQSPSIIYGSDRLAPDPYVRANDANAIDKTRPNPAPRGWNLPDPKIYGEPMPNQYGLDRPMYDFGDASAPAPSVYEIRRSMLFVKDNRSSGKSYN
ncbi:hypothetical protein O5D80_006528 [Batrachochytrium dendrobatidis]|nr:hypothetical protein O5D80_006528 [Batrachochytrium dendrobatidis]